MTACSALDCRIVDEGPPDYCEPCSTAFGVLVAANDSLNRNTLLQRGLSTLGPLNEDW